MTEPTDRLRGYAERLMDAVPPDRSRIAALRAIATVHDHKRRRLPKLAAATLGIFAITNVAAAAVSDSAAPGDLLYPIDRAYENAADFVGLGGDRSMERLDEAAVLVRRDDPEGAVQLLEESLDDESVVAAAASLRGTAPTFLRDNVAALITAARDVSIAARDGDADALAAARDRMHGFAEEVGSGQDRAPGQTDNPGQGGEPPGQNNQPPGQNDNPSQTAPGQTNPGQGNGNQDNPGQTAPGQTAPGQTAPGQTAPGQTAPGQTNPGGGGGNQDNPGQTAPGQTNPGGKGGNHDNPGQTAPGQTNPGGGGGNEDNPGKGKNP